MQKIPLFYLLILLSISLSGCEVIADIFKAGVGVGIFLVILVIVLILWLLSKFRNR